MKNLILILALTLVCLQAQATDKITDKITLHIECVLSESDCMKLGDDVLVRVKPEMKIGREQVLNAYPVEGETGEAFSLTLKEDAATKMAQITKDNVGKRMAILHQGKLLMAPVIRTEISRGPLMITVPGGGHSLIREVPWLNEALAHEMREKSDKRNRNLFGYVTVSLLSIGAALIYAFKRPRQRKKIQSLETALVTVQTFGSRSEAFMAKGLLETHNIPAFVFADDEGGLNPGMAYGIGVDVKVRSVDAARARELLSSLL